MLVFVLNCGSSSLRFQLIDVANESLKAQGMIERIGAVSSIASLHAVCQTRSKVTLQANNHGEAVDFVLDFLLDEKNQILSSVGEIGAVGHRVVHGGEDFSESVLIDAEVKGAIREAFDLAPLHNPANLIGIKAAMKAMPDIPHIAVFDTAFHQTLPPEAFLYAIPNRLYRRHKIRKYGFHGTSHKYVSHRLFDITELDRENSKLITCHLGNGASLAAIKNGCSIDTSMGMSPLAGLIMGTRSGDIDPSVLFYLSEKQEMTLPEVHTLLNKYSGLQGMSGYAADMRDLMAEADNGDQRCQQAIESFCYRAKGYIGQYLAILNGADAIIFTAGIGENSPEVRAYICDNLDHLGIKIDADINKKTRGTETLISTPDSKIAVWVIPTNEELVIAQDARKITESMRINPWT